MEPNNQKSLLKIIKKYTAGKASAEEIAFLEKYYGYFDKQADSLGEEDHQDFEYLEASGFKAIQDKIASSKNQERTVYYRYGAAAAIFLILVGTAVFLNLRNQKFPDSHIVTINNKLDVLPGTDKAVLILSDGKRVVLDSKSNENISENDGLTISKTKSGQLIYSVTAKRLSQNKHPEINTIETPKAGQYQVILPDGTKVWLNAASALSYPEFFAGRNRKVKLRGEAYFEVAKNKEMPFLVESDLQTVEVLGTHFNVNAYKDDLKVKTTLLEGSVKVSNKNSVQVLKPGEQAIVMENESIKVDRTIDTEDELAWKNGQFRFNNANLKSILKQLERWYDIRVDYDHLPAKRFNGMVPRKSNLSQVFNMLEKTGNIKFEIENSGQVNVLAL